MNNGWIKIYRKTIDNPIVCKDTDHLAVWIYLLCEATHSEIDVIFKGKRITLQPGQLITGRKKIADKFHISEYKVQRILKLFESAQQIAQQASNQNRLVTILNWEYYQQDAQQDEQRMHNGCTTDAQRMHTNKNVIMKECNNNNTDVLSCENSKIDYAKIVDLFHELCPSLPKVLKLNDKRKNKIKLRLQEMGNDYAKIEEVFKKTEASDFLRGEKNSWRASFDWLFENSTNWVKILEGNYDNRKTVKHPGVIDTRKVEYKPF